MPISRAAFQIRMPGKVDIGARQFGRAFENLESAAQQSGEAIQRIDGPNRKRVGDVGQNADAAAREEEFSQEIRDQALPNLPTADGSSAGTQEAIGSIQPQQETHRSVAPGRDAPYVPSPTQERKVTDEDALPAHAQTQVIERRLAGQRNAAAEDLARLHTVVERLLDLTDKTSNDGGQRLQSLEQRVAEMEMRYSCNRNSP
jgi:hypothetical protein